MIKILFIISIMLFGCTEGDKAGYEAGDSNPDVSGTTGIVSEDPPGADDWDDDSDTNNEDSSGEDSADSEEDADTDSDSGGEAPLESYADCSNVIDWRYEPDPLSHPCNFRLVDQNGNNIDLYDYEGDVIMLDFSTIWCGVCKTVAAHVQQMHDSLDPFSAITILTEDSYGNRPDVDDLQDWATEYNITTSPVLAGTDDLLGENPDQWNVNGIPCFFVIDKDFYLRKMQPGWNETTMTEYIESLILE